MGKTDFDDNSKPSLIVRKQLLILTENIMRSSSGQLDQLKLSAIIEESALTKDDRSLIKALVMSPVKKLSILDLSRNASWVKETSCAELLNIFIEQQQRLTELHFTHNPLSASLTTQLMAALCNSESK